MRRGQGAGSRAARLSWAASSPGAGRGGPGHGPSCWTRRPGMAVCWTSAPGPGGKTGHLAAHPAVARRWPRCRGAQPGQGIKALKQGNLGRLGMQCGRRRSCRPTAWALSGHGALVSTGSWWTRPARPWACCGRRPDVRWRRTPGRPGSVWPGCNWPWPTRPPSLLRPGGAHALCAPAPSPEAENQQVVARPCLPAANQGLRLEWPGGSEPGPGRLHGRMMAIGRAMPQRDRADAFFAARLVK